MDKSKTVARVKPIIDRALAIAKADGCVIKASSFGDGTTCVCLLSAVSRLFRGRDAAPVRVTDLFHLGATALGLSTEEAWALVYGFDGVPKSAIDRSISSVIECNLYKLGQRYRAELAQNT